MTKKIFSAVFAAMMLVSAAATAQTQTTSQTQACDQTKACDQTQACDQTKACCQDKCEFEGLNLTDTQKEQLKALKQKKFEQMKERKAERKAQRQAEKEQIKVDRRAMKQAFEADRRQYLDEVKEILGPDNYVIFLENQYVQSEPRGDRNPNFGPGQPGKMMKAKKGEGPKFEKLKMADKQKCADGKKACKEGKKDKKK